MSVCVCVLWLTRPKAMNDKEEEQDEKEKKIQESVVEVVSLDGKYEVRALCG